MMMTIPVVILAALSLCAGFVELPPSLGNIRIFSKFMNNALPAVTARAGASDTETTLMASAAIVSLIGIFLAYVLFYAEKRYADSLAAGLPGRVLHRLWFAGWGFDRVYETFLVRPFVWFARINRDDFIDLIYLGIIWTGRGLNNMLCLSQNGKVRVYAAGIAFGAVVALAVVVFL
jgi:NADH-quinone oxidoreductase subunit L